MVWALATLLAMGWLQGRAHSQELPPSPPLPIVVEAPADLATLWDRLLNPDFVLLDGKAYRELTKKTDEGRVNHGGAIIDSIELRGEVFDDRATLTMTISLSLGDAGPHWVPIKLDGLALSRVSEGTKEIPTRFTPGAGWEIEIRAAGQHRVVVSFSSPVKSTVEGRRIEWSIPEVAATLLSIAVEGKVAAASLGVGEPINIEPIEGGQMRRLMAHVSPRSRLVLDWKIDEHSDVALKPLISAQGQIAYGISLGGVTTRSNWEVQSLRGEVELIRLQFDPLEEVTTLEVDGQKRDATPDATGLLSIELTKPLSVSHSLKLIWSTRKPLPPLPATIRFSGHTLLEARTQTGLLAVRTADDLWINAKHGPLTRQIDPRSELPDELRNQPGKLLGFVFTDQPFDLTLQVEAPQPVARVAQATSIHISGTEARVVSWLDVNMSQGRLFEMSVNLGPELDLIKVGPAELVRSSRLIPLKGGRTRLLLQVAPLSRESGQTRLILEGRSFVPLEGSVALGLFEPLDPSGREHRLAISGSPNRRVEFTAGPAVRLEPLMVFDPAEWPSISGSEEGPHEILRAVKSLDQIELKVTSRFQRLRSSSVVQAVIRPESVEVSQRIELSTDSGGIDRVELTADPQIVANWNLDSGKPTPELAGLKDQAKAYITEVLGGEDGSAVITISYRLANRPGMTAGQSRDLVIPRVVVRGAVEAPSQYEITTGSNLRIDTSDDNWQRRDELGPFSVPRPSERLSLIADNGQVAILTLKVVAPVLVNLPGTIVPRLWLQTEVSPGLWRTIARYQVATNRPSLIFRLPETVKNLAVSVGGQTVSKIARSTNPPGYRLDLPAEQIGRGPILVEIDYALDPDETQGLWTAPEFVDVVIQQTVWEIDLTRSSVALKLPTGWTDESPIDWGIFQGFLGRPTRDEASIRNWFAMPVSSSNFTTSRTVQRLILSRNDAPITFRLVVMPRILLFALASAASLMLSLAVLIGRYRPRIIALTITVIASVSLMTLDSRLMALLGESSLLGVLLGLVAFGTQRVVERRSPVVRVTDTTGTFFPIPAPSSTAEYNPVGSDDSTAIRTRPESSRGRVVVDFVDPKPAASSTEKSP